jgi:transcriptional regulator with XRE-family HTH domain
MQDHTYADHMSDLATIAGLRGPGDPICERRIELGWSQSELAERAGVSQADISRIENGRLDARWSTIHRLATALESFTGKPKRSLANGSMNRDSVKPTGVKWAPKGPIAPLETNPT